MSTFPFACGVRVDLIFLHNYEINITAYVLMHHIRFGIWLYHFRLYGSDILLDLIHVLFNYIIRC
jgi:hypothetical protein